MMIEFGSDMRTKYGAQTSKTTTNDEEGYGQVEEVLQDPSNKTIDKERIGIESKTPTKPLAPPQPERGNDLEQNVNKEIRRSTRKRQPSSRFGKLS